MADQNLLVISNSYPNQDDTFVGDIFVKELVTHLSPQFKNIYVISPVALGIERWRGTKHEDYQQGNIKAFFPRYVNIPLFWFFGRPLWERFEARAITSLIERERLEFDLIHAHFTWPSGATAIRLKERYYKPVVITEHTSSTFVRAMESKDRAFITTWKKADGIIRIRERDISLFERVGIPIEKVTAIPNGFDSGKFRPLDPTHCRDMLHLPQDKKIVLNVGNMYDEVKGHKYLVEAMQKIVQKRKDVLCVIVGGGKLLPDIERQISGLSLSDNVILVNKRPHDEIPLWMNACDLFVLPSLNEGNPTVIPEALGCGKPFVGTNVGGIPEIVVSDTYGYLTRPADSDNLASKILSALDREWNGEAILSYAQQYSWAKIAEKTMQTYRKVQKS